jgi:hypothetical protein
MSARAFWLVVVIAAGCDPTPSPGSDPDGGPTSLLPADYAATFVEVRGCRPSIDHDLAHIVVKTSAALADVYRAGPYPFPVGALIVKEQFEDAACTRIGGWTLMRKEAPGYDPAFGDWHWQRLDGAGRVMAGVTAGQGGKQDGPQDGRGSDTGKRTLARCASCHAAAECRDRDFTCTQP